MNSFGKVLTLTTFGESHGSCIGGVLDGFPAGVCIDLDEVQQFVSYRAPACNPLGTRRNEPDTVNFLSGLLADNTTTGAPIAFIIHNKDANSHAYEALKKLFRPAHADYTYFAKYNIEPQPGGGRASARETAVRCVAGGIVRQWLKQRGVYIYPYISQVGPITLPHPLADMQQLTRVYDFASRCPIAEYDRKISKAIEQVRTEGDSLGGTISCLVKGVPAGVGEPLYDKLSARLAYAMLSVNAVKGFEVGDGFAMATMRGSEANDPMFIDEATQSVTFATNHTGGILGGISTGQDLFFRVAFKPTPTVAKKQNTITCNNEQTTIQALGRHDPAVVIRAVPVVEAMAALVIADLILQQKNL